MKLSRRTLLVTGGIVGGGLILGFNLTQEKKSPYPHWGTFPCIQARSCLVPVGSVAGKAITTIEGLSATGEHPLRRAWIQGNVPQCGYCQSGQIMSAAALLASNPNPTDADIDRAMAGNICRCGTYQRIRRAIHVAAEQLVDAA